MNKLVETTEVRVAQNSLAEETASHGRSPSALPPRTIIEALEQVAEQERELSLIAMKQIETGRSPNSYLEILRSFLEIRDQLYELTFQPVRGEFLSISANDLVLHLSDVTGYAAIRATI